MACAASDAENFVFSPISRALSRRDCRSSPVAPDTAATWLMAESKSAAVFTAAMPRPPTAVEIGMIVFPTPAIEFPRFSILPPISSILARAVLVVAASCWSRFNSCSVSMISRWRASYLSCPKSPFSSCSFACACACFKASSFSFVDEIASFSNFCFCVRSSVLAGSSFSSLLTSFKALWVWVMDELTLFKALSSPVVSPPISIVMPLILLATVPHLLKMCKRKARKFYKHFSEHKESTDHITDRCLV